MWRTIMLTIRTEKGKKIRYGEDIKIFITANDEAITFDVIFDILKLLFENEDRIYPPQLGFKGRRMLVNAILDLADGMSKDKLREKYKLI